MSNISYYTAKDIIKSVEIQIGKEVICKTINCNKCKKFHDTNMSCLFASLYEEMFLKQNENLKKNK